MSRTALLRGARFGRIDLGEIHGQPIYRLPRSITWGKSLAIIRSRRSGSLSGLIVKDQPLNPVIQAPPFLGASPIRVFPDVRR